MYAHHRATVDRVRETFRDDPEVLAVLLGGSIAHGFASDTSDVDIMIVISEEDYAKRRGAGRMLYWSDTLSTYGGGYVDGKYVSIDLMRRVRDSGSEPARFAYKDAQVIFSRIDGLQELLDGITRFPIAGKQERIARFYAQFQAWRWFYDEASRHDNPYLQNLAVSKLILFGGRLLLAHNEQLYPYHKWFLRVLAAAENKPAGIMEDIDRLCHDGSMENVEKVFRGIDGYRQWVDEPISWGQCFMDDSELNWLTGHTPIDDL